MRNGAGLISAVIMVAVMAPPAMAQDQAAATDRMHKPFPIAREQAVDGRGLPHWGNTVCSLAQQAGEPVLSVQIEVPGGAEADASGLGADVAIDAAAGVVPTVTAHAINTKGAGANDRDAPQPCKWMAPESLSVKSACTVRPVASCQVAADDKLLKFLITTPLSAFGSGAKTGHVTINRRGTASTDGALVVACDQPAAAAAGNRPIRGGWDIKVAKPL